MFSKESLLKSSKNVRSETGIGGVFEGERTAGTPWALELPHQL